MHAWPLPGPALPAAVRRVLHRLPDRPAGLGGDQQPAIGSGWGLANFSKVFASKFYLQAMQRSLEISFWSSLFGIVIATLGAYSLRRVDSKLRDFVSAFANMTSNFAGVPLAFAFIILLGFNGA
jgi:ABC-type uncharacterized transport system permease subunit